MNPIEKLKIIHEAEQGLEYLNTKLYELHKEQELMKNFNKMYRDTIKKIGKEEAKSLFIKRKYREKRIEEIEQELLGIISQKMEIEKYIKKLNTLKSKSKKRGQDFK